MNKLVREKIIVENNTRIYLDNQGTIDNDRRNNLQLKEDLLAKESSLFQAQSTISGLRKEMEQAREDVNNSFSFQRIFIFLDRFEHYKKQYIKNVQNVNN
jgi:hypothetical protein